MLCAALALALTGCGGKRGAEPSSARLLWASELGRAYGQGATQVSDPALAAQVERAAAASGARLVEVVVLALDEKRRGPVVTLEASDPATYLKHRLRGFLAAIGYFGDPHGFAFVELLDPQGRSAWRAGRWLAGGMVGSRPELDLCSPIVHSQPYSRTPPPPCPAD